MGLSPLMAVLRSQNLGLFEDAFAAVQGERRSLCPMT